jgi:hypothetical protein
MRENLNDFRLRRRVIGKLPAADIPGLFDGSLPSSRPMKR